MVVDLMAFMLTCRKYGTMDSVSYSIQELEYPVQNIYYNSEFGPHEIVPCPTPMTGPASRQKSSGGMGPLPYAFPPFLFVLCLLLFWSHLHPLPIGVRRMGQWGGGWRVSFHWLGGCVSGPGQ